MNNWTEPRTGMEFVRIPAGKFNMGNPLADAGEDESPVHAVDLDGFWLGRYPVTQAEWSHIMGSNPSSSKAGNYYPMENVSWNDIQEFIEKLNIATELLMKKLGFSFDERCQIFQMVFHLYRLHSPKSSVERSFKSD